jgi:hypothetical protein
MDLFGNLEKILKAFISFVPVSSIPVCVIFVAVAQNT